MGLCGHLVGLTAAAVPLLVGDRGDTKVLSLGLGRLDLATNFLYNESAYEQYHPTLLCVTPHYLTIPRVAPANQDPSSHL